MIPSDHYSGGTYLKMTLTLIFTLNYPCDHSLLFCGSPGNIAGQQWTSLCLDAIQPNFK